MRPHSKARKKNRFNGRVEKTNETDTKLNDKSKRVYKIDPSFPHTFTAIEELSMMEPEGQRLHNNEGFLSPSWKEDLPRDSAELEPMLEPNGGDSMCNTFERSGTVTTETQPAVTLETDHRPCSLFLCDTPSYDDDDSSLSSHSVPDLRKSYAFVESTSTDDGYEEHDMESVEATPDESIVPVTTVHTFKLHETTSPIATKVRSSFPRYSLFLGFLVGCFIQSSSLGANYVLTVLFGHDFEELQEHHNKIMIFSLVWSLATSTMGVLVVLFLRSLLQAVPNGSCRTHMNLWHIEYSFAFGALAGVCMAWCGTDILLGFRAHAFHSFLTLLFAVFAKAVLSCMARDAYRAERMVLDQEYDFDGFPGNFIPNDFQPLMENTFKGRFWENLYKHFKIHGTVLGMLIGFFIQMSSLGASFLLDAFAGEEDGNVSLTSDALLAFSLGWSFVFGAMGVMILLILRRLLMMVCNQISRKAASKLGLMLEFYFAVGCLVGVNLAWVLTDLGLGLQAHVMRSMLALGAAAIWCRVLACCFFSGRSSDDEEDDNDSLNTTPYVLVREQPVEVYEAVLLV